MTSIKHHVLISLASNTEQEQHLEVARRRLPMLLTDLQFTSEHWTEPVNSVRKNLYLNQLCKGCTTLNAEMLNKALKEMEDELGRTHNGDGIVAIDLDLLQFEEERFHLRDWEREYVKNLINEL